MNSITQNIKQRLSLRKPLAEALEVSAEIVGGLSLAKLPETESDLQAFLQKELAAVKETVPFMKDFERDFPSLAFSIATGIGKTRLMGACIAYLYLAKGIPAFPKHEAWSHRTGNEPDCPEHRTGIRVTIFFMIGSLAVIHILPDM